MDVELRFFDGAAGTTHGEEFPMAPRGGGWLDVLRSWREKKRADRRSVSAGEVFVGRRRVGVVKDAVRGDDPVCPDNFPGEEN